MANPDISKIIQAQVSELSRIKDRVLPVRIGRAVTEMTRENFRKGSFYGEPWPITQRQSLGFQGVSGHYGPLLSRTNHLMSSTDYSPGIGRVRIFNAVPYASTHNDGAQIEVTGKMKKFFWAKFFEHGGSSDNNGNIETQFWQRMALKPTGSRINIPRRHFLGPSPQVTIEVNKIINQELTKFANGINTRKNY